MGDLGRLPLSPNFSMPLFLSMNIVGKTKLYQGLKKGGYALASAPAKALRSEYVVTPFGVSTRSNPSLEVFPVLNKWEPVKSLATGGPWGPSKVMWDNYVEDPIGYALSPDYVYWDWLV